MDQNFFASFQNPHAKFRGKPFWAWNGKLEKDELLRQIHVMNGMGFGGFFMHSRTGLSTEYLGSEWFELINACADEAEKLGMEAWLYDEDRWPSGIAGGLVTADPAFRMRSIKLTIQAAEEFTWNSEILAAFSAELNGITYATYQRIHQHTPAHDYESKSVLVFQIVEMAKHSFYNGYTYLDTLNRKAADRFIELTHEKYKALCGDRLGKSIKGIFTDEPHRGTLMDLFGAGNEEDPWRAPWTGLLPQAFEDAFGYGIVDRLPELFLLKEGQAVSQVKWHYVELVTRMFLENFMIPVNEWCRSNNIILTGHVLHEDSLTAQTAMCGSVMRCYEHMGYPGVDVLTEHNRNYWIVKQLASAARQFGKKWMLSELYGCTGWQMTFESHKAVGDWQALLGINIRCPHLSWYTMEGEAKRDYPASILHQSTWWKEYRYVEDYFSRFGLIMSQGRPSCDVLAVSALESVWGRVFPGWAHMLSADTDEIKETEEKYASLFHWLIGAHIDFDYGDEDILSRHCHVSMDGCGKPVLQVGEATYRTIIIAGLTTIRSSTLKIVHSFLAAGGRVVFAGDPPCYVDALPSKDAFTCAAWAVCVPFQREALVESVCSQSVVKSILDEHGKNIEDVFCQVRQDGATQYIMLLNTNREKAYRNSSVTIRSDTVVEEWRLAAGERALAQSVSKDGFMEVQTDFEPGGERLFVTGSCNPVSAKKPLYQEKERIQMRGPYEYALNEPNVCVLDSAQYRINSGEWTPEKEILKLDREIRNQLGLPLRGGEMLQPWFTANRDFPVKATLELRFSFYMDTVPSGAVWLAMEKPEDFRVSINGMKISPAQADGWWIDKCFVRLAIPAGFIKTGANEILLETAFNEGTNLEALYLLGQFSVSLQNRQRILGDLPAVLEADDLVAQGFPFYTGKIRYKMNHCPQLQESGQVFVQLDTFEGACVNVIADGAECGMIAWHPYEALLPQGCREIALELVLTRRNTFGPLHLARASAPDISQGYGYGPLAFITEGQEFSDDYMLIASGLIAEPSLSIRS